LSAGDMGAWLPRRGSPVDARLPTLDLADVLAAGSSGCNGDITSVANLPTGLGEGALPNNERSVCL